MTPTPLNLFFVQCLIKPLDPTATWERFIKRMEGRQQYSKNPARFQKRSAERRAKNPEQARAACRNWRAKNPGDQKAANDDWNEKNSERRAELSKKKYWSDPEGSRAAVNVWRKNNPEKMRRGHRRYLRNRLATDPQFRLEHNCRTRINRALKRHTKGAGTLALLGMEIFEYAIYLQGQFQPGMTWENHGPVWHIDHIRPCSSFDLSNYEQQLECFNWSNTQPLFAKDNLQKGDRV